MSDKKAICIFMAIIAITIATFTFAITTKYKNGDRKMKNIHGIEIKAGQVWEDDCSEPRTAVVEYLPRSGGVLVWFNTESRLVRQESLYFTTLVSDPNQPWLPLPDGYRLLTAEERENEKNPGCAKVHNGNMWYDLPKDEYWREANRYYAIPVDHIWKEDEKPKYKLFEMHSKSEIFTVEDSDGCWLTVGTYPTIEEYRIGWGFTDDADWIENTAAGKGDYEGWVDVYQNVPCDHTGNKKYAIGRLEE